MTEGECFKAIVDNGLSLRMIPLEVVGCYSISNLEWAQKCGDFFKVEVDNSGKRPMVKTWRKPKYAGYWLCKQVTDTNSMVKWDSSRDCLAPSLIEAVGLWLTSRSAGGIIHHG